MRTDPAVRDRWAQSDENSFCAKEKPDRATLAEGSTWNASLVGEVGRVTGREARALGYTNVYSPVLDLPGPSRSPL